MRLTLSTVATVSLLGFVACGGDDVSTTPDASELPAWQTGLPAAAVMGSARGLTPARGIIHLHSPFSHDACDGEPRPGGAVDEVCLARLRAALCVDRIDYAALTDHDDSMADEDFATLFAQRDDDDLVLVDGRPIASRIHCDNGHDVLVSIGGENPLMPIMLDRHVTGTVAERHATYNADTPAAVAAFHDAGGLVWIPHTEQRTTAELVALAPDGLEIYNLHANLDPAIRRDWLELDPGGAIAAVAEFADTNPGSPEPDLALLAFVEPSLPALARWNELLGMGLRVSGSAGTDAHENALPILLRDGDRGDSYRRMMQWFANVVLVDAPGDPVAIEAALRAGRMFVVFELMGTPVGFEVHARAGATTVELGGEVPADGGYQLSVTVPTLYAPSPLLPAPSIRARVLRVDASGVTEVAAGAGPTLTAPLDQIAAYRVEVLITPHQLGPYLGRLGPAAADRERTWIYANPIYVVGRPR